MCLQQLEASGQMMQESHVRKRQESRKVSKEVEVEEMHWEGGEQGDNGPEREEWAEKLKGNEFKH